MAVTRDTSARDKEILLREKMIKAIRSRPSVSVIAEGYHSRTTSTAKKGPRAFAVIIRSQIKRNRKRLKMTLAVARRIARDTDGIRVEVMSGRLRPHALLNAVGRMMSKNTVRLIHANLTRDTGETAESIGFKVQT